jgi:hypothetical protein
MRSFWGGESTQIPDYSIPLNSCLPAPLAKGHTKQSADIIRFRSPQVLNVDGLRAVPKIAQGVVALVPVQMVNAMRRERACRIQPCQSVSEVVTAIQTDLDVPVVI